MDGSQSSITEPELEQGFETFLPNQTPACDAELGQFFTQWFDTAHPVAGTDKPQITGPGLHGGGFHCTS
jgi:hypothetical protein